MTSTRRAVLVDIDNTLYDFDLYFAATMWGTFEVLANDFNVSRAALIRDLHDHFTVAGTLDHAIELWRLRRTAAALRSRGRLAHAQTAIDVVANSGLDDLVVYDGVYSGLDALRSDGILLIGLSDAPAVRLRPRLRSAGLEEYFHVLLCWSGRHHPSMARRQFAIPDVRCLADGGRKPNPELLGAIVAEFGLERPSTYLVGDNLEKDIDPALRAGIHPVWARYGASPRDWVDALIAIVAPWQSPRPTDVRVPSGASVIDRFDAVLDIVGLCNGPDGG